MSNGKKGRQHLEMLAARIPATDADRAYAAGLLDGEGSITLGGRRDGPRGRIRLRVTVANTYLPVMDWLQERWGGSVQITHKPNRRPCGVLRFAALSGLAFIQDVRPYLIIKARQADNAIAFQTRVKQRGSRLSDAQWAELERFMATQKSLNQHEEVIP